MKRLIFIGAGGFGREVWHWAWESQGCGTEWEPYGFVDDNPDVLNPFGDFAPVLGNSHEYQPGPEDCFVCSVGNPTLKKEMVKRLASRGAQFLSVIHQTALIGARSKVGEGVIVCPYSVITTDVTVGDHVGINLQCTLGHDVRVGDYVQLSAFTDLTGKVQLGDAVFAGSHVSCLPGVSIGDRARLGAGSVVIRDVSVGSTVFGNPAKEI